MRQWADFHFFAEVRTKPKGEILWQKIHLWDIS